MTYRLGYIAYDPIRRFGKHTRRFMTLETVKSPAQIIILSGDSLLGSVHSPYAVSQFSSCLGIFLQFSPILAVCGFDRNLNNVLADHEIRKKQLGNSRDNLISGAFIVLD